MTNVSDTLYPLVIDGHAGDIVHPVVLNAQGPPVTSNGF